MPEFVGRERSHDHVNVGPERQTCYRGVQFGRVGSGPYRSIGESPRYPPDRSNDSLFGEFATTNAFFLSQSSALRVVHRPRQLDFNLQQKLHANPFLYP